MQYVAVQVGNERQAIGTLGHSEQTGELTHRRLQRQALYHSWQAPHSSHKPPNQPILLQYTQEAAWWSLSLQTAPHQNLNGRRTRTSRNSLTLKRIFGTNYVLIKVLGWYVGINTFVGRILLAIEEVTVLIPCSTTEREQPDRWIRLLDLHTRHEPNLPGI